jgi:hypothetical protein
MRNWTKAALLGAGLIGTALAAGCAYDDDAYDRGGYYDDGGYYSGRTYHRDDQYRDRDGRDDHASRVRVCDDDGSNCHWEYRRP